MADRRPVVVGVNDSPEIDAAMKWASGEATARKTELEVIGAYSWAPSYLPVLGYAPHPDPNPGNTRRTAEQFVATATNRVRGLQGGGSDVGVRGDAVEGRPVSVLVEASERAAVIVVGSRHLSALGSAVLGSVGGGVSARAACPVVVVRGPAGDPDERAQVIIGIDPADPADAVLQFAFEHASRHEVDLEAVLCWHPDLLAAMSWRAEPPPPDQAETWLSETLARWRKRFPDVTVHSGVIRDHPVAGLVAASVAQSLLVVGRRTRHALLGTLLGSVSQGVLHHATCPVAVIPNAKAD